MNILGIDYGTKNIGLAWVDTDLGIVLPYGVLRNEERGTRNEELAKLIKKEKADKIVIGLPLTLEDGAENPNTKRVRAFGNKLEKLVDLPIEFIDERLSSFEADNMGGDLTKGQTGASRDEKAAMIILQEYLSKSL